VVQYADGTTDQKPATSLTFLLNFFDELRRHTNKKPPQLPAAA